MDIKKSTYVVAVFLALLGATGCGGSDELSDEELEILEEYVDTLGDGTSVPESAFDDDFEDEDSFEEF